MNPFTYLAVLAVALFSVNARESDPKVQVYSRLPGLFEKANTLICHVSNFHPPDITITLLEDGKEMPGSIQTDLAFEQTWQFHLTRTVGFTPVEGRQYACEVRHMKKPARTFSWGHTDMYLGLGDRVVGCSTNGWIPLLVPPSKC
ncbi:hypothetical protein AAFF_G00417670 [Aldrovandia affinis]|uniref:Beta-2-microglobulin n=1 Tax=Aldrovandia affinis TaxID=143900 RepID=A0AAD7SAB2_9TELE|nr:hypothetical protein AAFF_G00417670 [Aldrovandia affinis]